RAGPGTKIVCLGNLAQIDTPYMTEGSSGLTYVVDRFMDWPHPGHITLPQGERSRLADFANSALYLNTPIMRTTTPANNLQLLIALTVGDAAGIGPELCVRLLSQAQEVPGIIYGDLVSLQRALALTDLDQVYLLIAISHPIQYARISMVENQIPVLQCGPPLPEDLPYG